MELSDIEIAIHDDIGWDLCRQWLRRQSGICRAVLQASRQDTCVSDLNRQFIEALHASDERFDGLPLEDRISAFVVTLSEFEEHGRELAGCGIDDNGLDDVPGWLDWQCFLADRFARNKAEAAGMPAHIATLTSAVMCGALRDHVLNAVAGTRDKNQALH